MDTYTLSVPDDLVEEVPVGGEVCAVGCGSTEYAFNTKQELQRAERAVAAALRQLADQFERGVYSEVPE